MHRDSERQQSGNDAGSNQPVAPADGRRDSHILNLPSMFDVAELFGQTIKDASRIAEENQLSQSGISFQLHYSWSAAGSVTRRRVFPDLSAGQFHWVNQRHALLSRSASKCGKPIIDRVVRPETSIGEALKSALVSFDSTMKSNLARSASPIDVAILKRDHLKLSIPIA